MGKEIRAELDEALGGKAQISIKRWLPGVQKNEDCDAAHTRRPSAEHNPQDAFKQAHLIMEKFEKEKVAGGPQDGSDDSTTHRQREVTPNPTNGANSELEKPSSRLMSSMDQSIQAGNVSQVLDDDMMQAEESRQVSDEEQDQDQDVELSYIYGDEDSEHQKLEELEESASQSWSERDGYESNGDQAVNRRASTPVAGARQSDTEDDGAKMRVKVTAPTRPTNGASTTLEMKMVASTSVNEEDH